MKDLTDPLIDRYRQRLTEAKWSQGNDFFNPSNEGCFAIPSPVDKRLMTTLVSSGYGWDHVSVSRGQRCPYWEEMEYVRRVFFHPDECVMQLHPPLDEYITGEWPGRRSIFTLHLWRPQESVIPRPPGILVGANSAEQYQRMLEAD